MIAITIDFENVEVIVKRHLIISITIDFVV